MALWLPFLGLQVSGARDQCRLPSPGLGLPVCAAGRRDPARPGQLPRRPRWSCVCPDGVSWGDACSWARAGAGGPLPGLGPPQGGPIAGPGHETGVRAGLTAGSGLCRPSGAAGRGLPCPSWPMGGGQRRACAPGTVPVAPPPSTPTGPSASTCEVWRLPSRRDSQAPRGRARRGVHCPLPRQAAPRAAVWPLPVSELGPRLLSSIAVIFQIRGVWES